MLVCSVTTLFVLLGATIAESQRFSIKYVYFLQILKSSRSPSFHNNTADFSGSDVPLHISVRFDEGKVVMNSFSNGEWGKEQRKSNPLKRGEPFMISVRAHDDQYQVCYQFII